MNKNITIPSFLLISFLIRLLITGASIGDAIVIIAFSALYAAHVWFEETKQPVNQDVKDRIINLEQDLQKTKDKLNGVNLSAALRR